MDASKGPAPILGLHTTQSTGLLPFIDLVMANPHQYHDIKLREAVLCDTGVGVRHESIVFKLSVRLGDGNLAFLYVVGERVTAPQLTGDNTPNNALDIPPGSPLPAPTRSSSPLRLPTLGSSDSITLWKGTGLASDCLRRWEPARPEAWWQDALGTTVNPLRNPITKFDFSERDEALTLIDVVLAMRSANIASPEYSVTTNNCWWFARSVLLLLCLVYDHSPDSPNDQGKTINHFFKQAPTPKLVIDVPLSDQVIEKDVCAAFKPFLELVRVYFHFSGALLLISGLTAKHGPKDVGQLSECRGPCERR